jgi:hypothetical protein
MAMEANEVKSEDQPGGRTGGADCERASEYVASPAVHVASAMQGLEELGVIAIDDEHSREAVATILHEVFLSGQRFAEREASKVLSSAERVNVRPPCRHDDRAKVVIIIPRNGRRESIIVKPEAFHIDNRAELVETAARGVDEMVIAVADWLQRNEGMERHLVANIGPVIAFGVKQRLRESIEQREGTVQHGE